MKKIIGCVVLGLCLTTTFAKAATNDGPRGGYGYRNNYRTESHDGYRDARRDDRHEGYRDREYRPVYRTVVNPEPRYRYYDHHYGCRHPHYGCDGCCL